jgi:hypothetical protein
VWQQILPRTQPRLHLDTSRPIEDSLRAATRAIDDLVRAAGRREAANRPVPSGAANE